MNACQTNKCNLLTAETLLHKKRASRTAQKKRNSFDKENPKYNLFDSNSDLHSDIVEYIDYMKQQSHSRNQFHDEQNINNNSSLNNYQKKQSPSKSYNLSRCVSVPLLNMKQRSRQSLTKSNLNQSQGDKLSQQSSKGHKHAFNKKLSLQNHQNENLHTQESYEPTPQNLLVNMCDKPVLTLDIKQAMQSTQDYLNDLMNNEENQQLTTERTEITNTTDISQQYAEDDIFTTFKTSDTLRELFSLANFYQNRNQERISIKQLNLFPFSTESDFEEDPSLPIVYPPFLPSKTADTKEYTLVLDLDETLIHFDDNEEADNDGEVFYMVRPGVNKFLSELSLYYEIVIFTAALSEYADWILNQIDQKKNITHRLYRQHTKRKDNYAIKDLSLLGRDIKKTLIIDNIGENFIYTQPFNGIQIISWYDDLDDNELDKLLPFLKEMVIRQEPDIRNVLEKYSTDFEGYLEITLYEEEKQMRKSRRDFSADDKLFKNQLIVDRKSGVGELLTNQQYISKKKNEEDDETENLIEKCMLSQPNKYSVEQIKKQHAYVWSFGQNTKGELGVGHYNEVMMPERVRGLPKMKIIHLSSGAKHTGAVSEDGSLWMCGSNLHDKLGLEGITTGSKKTFKPVDLLNHIKVKQVACGDYHTMCLTLDGQVFVWGGSLHNKRGDKSEERRTMPKYQPTLLKILERKTIVQIGCGDFHSLALEDNGTLYSWGMGEKGECGHGKFEDVEIPQRIKFFDGKIIIQIETGNHHTLALTSENQIYAWGDGRYGQCGYGEYENTAIPQLINFPNQQSNQTQYIDDSVHQEILDFFKEPPKIKQMAAGEMHSIVLTSNGQIFSFGYNSQGQLGHNNTENYCRPKLVESMLSYKVVQVTTGRNHSLALTTKNDVYACGNGQNGQLGLPDKDMRKVFTHVLSLMSVNSVKMYAGGLHSWVVLDDLMPKKDEFQALKGPHSLEDSLLNSPRDETMNQFASQLDIGGKSEASNWNFFNDHGKHSKYVVQVNYTDTTLSHRFIRFELSDQNLEQGKVKVEEFIRLMYKEEGGTIYHRLQEDQDILGERGQIMAPGKGKHGKFFTLQIVSDISKNEDTVEPRRELIKNNFDFIDQVYDLFIRHTLGVVGYQPQKTSIGMQIFMRDHEINQSEYEKKLCQWASLFSKQLIKYCSSRIKYFELRPYSYAPV